MKVGILVNLKHGHAYEEIAKAAELGFTNGQLNVWDQKLHDEESIAEVKRACRIFPSPSRQFGVAGPDLSTGLIRISM